MNTISYRRLAPLCAAAALAVLLGGCGSSPAPEALSEESETQASSVRLTPDEGILSASRRYLKDPDAYASAPNGQTGAKTQPSSSQETELLTSQETDKPSLADEETPITVTYPDSALKLEPPLNGRLLFPLSLPKKSMTLLNEQLAQMVSAYDGTWSVYVKDLSTGEEALIGDQPMKSASIMKLFILGAVYDAIDQGALERTDELTELMSSMIIASSNSAANELIRRLGNGDFDNGVDAVNAYIHAQGYSDATVLCNGFQEDSLILDPTHTNQTSALDAGTFLYRVYTRSLGRRSICNEIEEWMLAQETRYKIPRALPENVLAGNKTGETDEVENDCAVVYTPQGDYLLCIFSSDWGDKEAAQEQITALSGEVYRYFCDPGYIRDLLHQAGRNPVRQS